MKHEEHNSGDRHKGKRRRVRREPGSLGAALRQSVGPLMRQFRKFTAMRECLGVLPRELAEARLAAPFDVRLAPARYPGASRPETGAAGPPGVAEQSAAGVGLEDVNTMYFYVASRTVEAVLERQKRRLISEINARLEFAFIEEFRYEEAGAQKIERQLNILALTPD
jgi:hypothetical protein